MIVFLSNNTVSRIKTIVAFGIFVFLLFMSTGLLLVQIFRFPSDICGDLLGGSLLSA